MTSAIPSIKPQTVPALRTPPIRRRSTGGHLHLARLTLALNVKSAMLKRSSSKPTWPGLTALADTTAPPAARRLAGRATQRHTRRPTLTNKDTRSSRERECHGQFM